MGELLRALRLERGLTMVEMGRVLGFSAPHLCEIENGNKLVSPERAARMAATLGLDEALCVTLALQDLLDQQGLKMRVYLSRP